MRALICAAALALATPATLAADYTPPSAPRSEARYGALYRTLREADAAAGQAADRAFPPSSGGDERVRLRAWEATYDRELRRRYAAIARRARTTVDDLLDVRDEGDARAWFADPARRARLGKTEDQIRDDLRRRRAARAAARAAGAG